MYLKAGTILLAAGVCLATAAEYNGTQQRTFQLSNSGSERRLLVSNINGNIRLTSVPGNEIRITVQEHWSGHDDAEIARGRSDVRLVMEQDGNFVSVTLDGSFRKQDRSWDNWDRRQEYDFRHDFEITAPPDVALKLRTVNGRDLTISGSTRYWELSNVNGRITAEGLAGYGKLRTVNGQIKATLLQSPAEPCSFETVNGSVEVTFPPNLNADLRLSSMHGDAFTDFDVQPLTTRLTSDAHGNGNRFRLESGRRLRVGSGGVEHSFKTLNGTIKIRKGEKGK